jgi:hypothetical protein
MFVYFMSIYYFIIIQNIRIHEEGHLFHFGLIPFFQPFSSKKKKLKTYKTGH